MGIKGRDRWPHMQAAASITDPPEIIHSAQSYYVVIALLLGYTGEKLNMQ